MSSACFIKSRSALTGSGSPGRSAPDFDAVLRCVRSREQSDFVEQAAEVHFDQMQFAGAHEVDQSLHDSIKPLNLAADNVHVAAGVGIQLRQLVLQELQSGERWR